MAFRTRRQHRYQILRLAGMLPFEARELSRVPFKVPYMDALIRERHKRYEVALAKKMSRAEYERQIKTMYFDGKWRKRTRTGRIVYDTWAMLRDFEDKYRAKHPDYESPWEKRRKAWKDFVGKLERTYQKYPRKMPSVKLRYLPEGGAEIVKE